MKRTNQVKARISLNSRKQVSLFVGKSTPVNLNPYLELSNYSIEHFRLFQFSANSDVSEHIFFEPTKAKESKRYAMYDEALRNFVEECIKILNENTPTTAKELFNLTSYGEHKETVSMTFGEWLQRVIDLYRYDNPYGNKKAATWKVYDAVRIKCQLWDNGAILDKPIADVTNEDFAAFGKWIETKLCGANYRNLMKNFASVIHKAIEASKETGCTEAHNHLDYKLTSKNIVRYDSDGMPIEKAEKRCFTEEQIKMLRALNTDDIQITNRNKCLMSADDKQMYTDIIKFALHSGMRPIDLLRLKKDAVKQGKTIVYRPHKDDRILVKRSTNKKAEDYNAITPIYGDMQRIINKYSAMTDDDCRFIFPIKPNTKHKGKYVSTNEYARYNHIEADINLVLRAMAKTIGIQGKGISLYTCRHSVITMLSGKKDMSIVNLAKMMGTSPKMLYDYYIHAGIEDLSNILNAIAV